MITYIVQIGNSDDKLTQGVWVEFVNELNHLLAWELGVKINFFGYSPPNAPWQNCCAVFEAGEEVWHLSDIQERLSYMAAAFKQDSIAVTIGSTVFIEASS